MRTRVDTTELVAAMRHVEQQLEVTMPQALALIGDRIVNEAKRTTLFTDRTTNLRRSILRGPITGSFGEGKLEIDVMAGGLGGVTYARAVHDGSRAHDIRPKRRRSLRFVGASGGFVFRRVVHHPGTAARPFMTQAIEANVPFAERTFGNVIKLSFARAGFA